jgi:TRAP-type C4-dicarboxylate transport system substrate-binding protein
MQSKPLIDTINAFGATAVPMGQSEVYVGLQQKVIDGWENNEPTVLTFNMQEVCKYFSYTRHTSIPDILVMSKSVFDATPKNIQKAILDAAAKAVPYQRKIWAAYIDDAVKQLKAKGMVFNEVNNIGDFQALAKPIYKEFEPVVGADLIHAGPRPQPFRGGEGDLAGEVDEYPGSSGAVHHRRHGRHHDHPLGVDLLAGVFAVRPEFKPILD